MKYIEMFEDIEPLNRGKPTERRYAKIRDFIKTKSFAEELDNLKVPQWYVLRFIESDQYRISFLERQITEEQKFQLFKKSLTEPVICRNKKTSILWHLKEWNYDVGDYIRAYRESTITPEERKIIKETAQKLWEKRQEEHKKFRAEHGNLFDFSKLFDFKDNYKILGVERTASKDEVKKAYRNLAKQHHPDVGGNVEKFREINQAYEKLMMRFGR